MVANGWGVGDRGRILTYVLGGGVTLEVGLDGLVLLVEMGQVRDEVLDNVGVRQRVELDVGRALCGDTAWSRSQREVVPGERKSGFRGKGGSVHKQARVFWPLMFMAQLPQIPSRQLLRKVRVGSSSFLMRMRASSIMGPVLLRSRV